MSAPRTIAVVGAGMAAARLAQQLEALGAEAEVTLYGGEPEAPYNRALIADVLTGRHRPADLALPVGAARLRTGSEVVALDPAGRTLTLADGDRARYDELVLATGANPVLPPLRGLFTADGSWRTGLHALRSLADCARLAADAATAHRAVVIGGGVLGVSAARALAALGLPVEIVHQGPHLLERHLDEGAAHAVRQALAGLGVETYPANRARALDGEDRVAGVTLATGRRLDADLVVLACGVRPRTGLAHSAGLPVGRGIQVDDTLACAPGTYAIGDCAEHRGVVHGLAAPAWDQADLLARRLSGADPDARWTGTRTLARLTAGPLEYAAFGVGEAPADADVLCLGDATRGTYRRLVLRGDRLLGGALVGDLATAGTLSRAWLEGRPVGPDPLSLLLAPPAPGAANPARTAVRKATP